MVVVKFGLLEHMRARWVAASLPTAAVGGGVDGKRDAPTRERHHRSPLCRGVDLRSPAGASRCRSHRRRDPRHPLRLRCQLPAGCTFRAVRGPPSVTAAAATVPPRRTRWSPSPNSRRWTQETWPATRSTSMRRSPRSSAASRSSRSVASAIVSIGGDHTVVLPILRSMQRRHGPVALVHFDAHLDTWDTYFGAPYTHGTLLRRAAEEGLFRDDASMHVGIRGPLYARQDMVDDAGFGFRTIRCDDVQRLGIDGVVEAIRERVGDHPLYVSIDIDVLDPAHAPGTGTPEIGGMNSRELLIDPARTRRPATRLGRRRRGLTAVRPRRAHLARRGHLSVRARVPPRCSEGPRRV